MAQDGDHRESQIAIAIIGMSGRFPGARNVPEFWDNLRKGRESIRKLTSEELIAAGVSPGLVEDPSYVNACGYLDGIDQFDAGFFGLSPRDAAVFDPQHRFFLECAWEAFESAGYVGERIDGPVGVFAASGASEYFTYNLVTNQEVFDSIGAWLLRHTGNDANFLATRVSYELNLNGPSMNVQAACSSSLVAVHMACQSLLNGECDVALAGASTIYPDQTGYLYKPSEILSLDGHCRPFDADASGTVMASATGCVLLKRLSDAVRDGDCIRAVIRGSAVNNDGSDKVGYLAPSVSGQARVISEALNLAGVQPAEISYVEAHGTGTLMGDPIEVAALVEAFGTEAPKHSCALGSLKSNIGHTGEASGICSLIKVICALEHKELPATLHYRRPNPQFDLANSPFFVNASLRPWDVPPGKPRIAGITSLGAGGTNAHIVLEEPPKQRAHFTGATSEPRLLVLSARSSKALEVSSRNLADHLRDHSEQCLDDVAFTLAEGREAFDFRRALVASSASSAAALLSAKDSRGVYSGKVQRNRLSTVFMFPGGGAQYSGMGAELYEKVPEYRDAIDACLAVVQPDLGVDLRTLMYAPPGNREIANLKLEAPSLALPALFATEYALAKLLQSWGLSPSALVGHSAGEYTAACVAGVLSMRDAISLVAMRGRLFEKLPRGGMLSIALAESELRKRLDPDLSIAAVNGPALCVASGPVAAIARLEKELLDGQIESTRVHIDVAAHSAMLEPILPEFESYCRRIRFAKPRIPIVSNFTGTWITDAEAIDPAYWVQHLRHTVRFDQCAVTLLESGGRALIEVGPGRTLSNLCRQQASKAAAITHTLRHPQEDMSDVAVVLEGIGRIWASGGDVDLGRLQRRSRGRVPLPTYPFERQRYWIEKGTPAAASTLTRRSELAQWFSAPTLQRAAHSAALPPEELRKPWLVFLDGSSLAAAFVSRLRQSGAVVATVKSTPWFRSGDSLDFGINPANFGDYALLKEELRRKNAIPVHVVHMWALAPRPWRLWASASDADLVAWDRDVVRYHHSLLSIAKSFAFEGDCFRLTAIGTAIEALDGESDVHPEKATLTGVCRALPREFPGAVCSIVDVKPPLAGSKAEAKLLDDLWSEVQADKRDTLVVLRKNGRWVQRFEQLPLEAGAGARPWLTERGVYIVTGGLGGIGLEVMGHLARHGKARIVSVGRSALPNEAAWDTWLSNHGADDETSRKIKCIREMRDAGSEVMLATADVADRKAMSRVVSEARQRFGGIDGVFHCAGLLNDQLIAIHEPAIGSQVLEVKARGALVLQSLFEDGELDFFVLFSSVSSVLGLPGQADYTAANACLDALAKARAARGCRTHTVSIDWNAWKDVGMLAKLVRELPMGQGAGARTESPIDTCLGDDEYQAKFRADLSAETHWMLGEHVVNGGPAVIPGTGYLEVARAALAHRPENRPVEIRDLTFLQPFTVAHGETRTLNVKLDRTGDCRFQAFGANPDQVYATACVAYVDDAVLPPQPISAIRQRCLIPIDVDNGRLKQRFMNFGPRWANIKAIHAGTNEALIDIELPAPYHPELVNYPLHPAMMDMATGTAQMLIAGFDASEEFYVPFSYGRVLIRGSLPPRLHSHVTLRSADGKTAIFDATIFDGDGNVLVTVERYIMRRSEGFASAPVSPRAAKSRRTNAEDYLREGMTSIEGLTALDRILANPVAPQVIASTLDIDLWLARLSRGANGPQTEIQSGDAAASLPRDDADFVAPRDACERELANMWKELLGVQNPSITDDFFELGGQSLIAVRLLNRICREYAVTLPLSVLFQAPTIAATAELLRGPYTSGEEIASPTAETTIPFSVLATAGTPMAAIAKLDEHRVSAETHVQSLVKINEGGNRPALFCVHGAGGNILNFRDVSRMLHEEQPFFGLQARGIDGASRPHVTIEEMAEAYIKEVRTHQPQGPYFLAGYSGGGIVAFEMARQLSAIGEDVPLIVFFDTFHPQMPLRTVDFRRRLFRLREECFEYFREIAFSRVERLRGLRERRVIDRCIREGEIIPFELRDRHLRENFAQAASSYNPQPWPGRAILFRAEKANYIYGGSGLSYGWDKVVMGGIETIVVPGNHDTLLLGANSRELMKHLNIELETAHWRLSQQTASAEVA